MPTKTHGMIRWKLVPVMIGAVALLFLLGFFFYEIPVKKSLELQLSRVNGALVDIGAISLSVSRRHFEIKNLAFADPQQPAKNWLEIEEISGYWSPRGVLQKKLILRNVDFKGFKTGTQRNQSGNIEHLFTIEDLGPNLFDRAAFGSLSNIRRTLPNNPLRQLGAFSRALTLASTLEKVKSELSSYQKVSELKLAADSLSFNSQVEHVIRTLIQWLNEEQDRLKSRSPAQVSAETRAETIKKIDQYENWISETLNERRTQWQQLKESLEQMDGFIQADVRFLAAKLEVPSLTVPDLSEAVFRRKMLGYAERIIYWVDLARRRIPHTPNSPHLELRLDGKGTDVYFPQEGERPRFVLDQAKFYSDAQLGPHHGTVQGELDRLASEGTYFDNPLYLDLTFEFPEKSLGPIHLELTADHSNDPPKEKVTLELASFHPSPWSFFQAPEVELQMIEGKGQGKLEAEFQGPKVHLQWQSRFQDAKYQVRTSIRMVENALVSALTPWKDFTLDASIDGTFTDAEFRLESSMGRVLAVDLEKEFRHPIAAVEDSMETALWRTLDPLMGKTRDRLRLFSANELAVLEAQLEKVKELKSKWSPTPSKPDSKKKSHT